MSMYKIALNAGHGLNTAGKRCLASLDPNEGGGKGISYSNRSGG